MPRMPIYARHLPRKLIAYIAPTMPLLQRSRVTTVPNYVSGRTNTKILTEELLLGN